MDISIVYGFRTSKYFSYTPKDENDDECLESMLYSYISSKTPYMIGFGGGNSEPEVYVGVEVENFVSGYGVDDVTVSDILNVITTAKTDEIEQFKTWWSTSEKAAELKTVFNAADDLVCTLLLVMSSD